MDTLNIPVCILFVTTLVLEGLSTTLNSTVSLEQIKTKSPIKIVSEGGSIITNNSNAQSNDYLSINLDSGFDKSSKSSIVPRKKVDFMEDLTDLSPNNLTVLSNATQNLNTNLSKYNNTGQKEAALNIPKTVHKPLVLSYEGLVQTDEKNNVFISENEPSIKIQKLNTNSHPGMVMPIIITILVVPMFAVVGYMAIKRGREAWKNRHYKRMDFLLDGMYNE